MKNERLYSYMKKKGVSIKLLSELSEIPETTLSRIINNQVKNVKLSQKDAISKALNVPISTIFQDIPFDEPLLSPVRPEEACTVINKTLSEDESLLLYLYQNCTIERRRHIIEKLKIECSLSQKEVFNRSYTIAESETDEYIQISFDMLNTKKEA